MLSGQRLRWGGMGRQRRRRRRRRRRWRRPGRGLGGGLEWRERAEKSPPPFSAPSLRNLMDLMGTDQDCIDNEDGMDYVLYLTSPTHTHQPTASIHAKATARARSPHTNAHTQKHARATEQAGERKGGRGREIRRVREIRRERERGRERKRKREREKKRKRKRERYRAHIRAQLCPGPEPVVQQPHRQPRHPVGPRQAPQHFPQLVPHAVFWTKAG